MDKANLMSRQVGRPSAAQEVAQRILGLQRAEESDADFARRLGITPQRLHHYKQGGGASLEAILEIAKHTHLAFYLLTSKENPDFPLELITEREAAELMDLLDQARDILSAALTRSRRPVRSVRSAPARVAEPRPEPLTKRKAKGKEEG